MTRGVKICMAAAAVIFVAAVISAIILGRPADSNKVAVIRDGDVLYEFDLMSAEDQEINIEYENGGYNLIEISGGEIRIKDADCPDKTCIKTGTLRSADIPIVCLPHHLIVRYEDEVK